MISSAKNVCDLPLSSSILMPSVAIGRRYTDMLVWDIISVTLISVTFYRYGDDFLIFSLVDTFNKIRFIIDLLSLYERILLNSYWSVFTFWSLIVKFAQHHLLSKIFISLRNSVTEMTSPTLQHMKFECWVKSPKDHAGCSFKWLCTIMNTFHNKKSKFDKLFFFKISECQK